jgi:hypothetical protein
MNACGELAWRKRAWLIDERHGEYLLDLVSQQAFPQHSGIQTVD